MTPSWKSFFALLRAPRTVRPSAPPRTLTRRGLAVERLEDRLVPALVLRYSADGGATFTSVTDEGPGDAFPGTPGIVGADVGPLTVSASSVGLTTNEVSFLTLGVAGTGAGGSTNMVVQATLTDVVTAPAPQTLTYSFTGSVPDGGTVTARTWVDGGNAPFGTGALVADTGVKPMQTDSALAFAGAVPYSVTTELRASYTTPAELNVSLNTTNQIDAGPSLGTIRGVKSLDLLNDGFGPDNVVLSGVTVNLYQGTAAVGTPFQTTTTDGNGAYQFTGLAPGAYFVQEVVPGGYTQTGGGGGYSVALAAGAVVTDKDFANFRPGTISGRKVTDLTGNGFSVDDTALSGVTIELYKDADNDGVLTDADGARVAFTTTATDGTFGFTGLPLYQIAGGAYLGTYFVKEVVPAGYVQTAGPSVYKVTLDPMGTAAPVSTGNDFANFQLAAISGRKVTDLTANGFSVDDTALSGVTIELYKDANNDGVLTDADGAAVDTRVTATAGTYSFTGLTPGTYFVKEVVPAGSIQTAGSAVYTVTTTSGQVATGRDFGNFQLTSISGTKFRDLTGNGFSGDDTPLNGVTINLYAGSSATGTPLQSVVSGSAGATGTYSFTGLTPGTYFVQETVPNGWTQTGGAAGYVVVVGGSAAGALTSGGAATGNNFANYPPQQAPPGSISGFKYLDVTGNGYSADDTPLGGVTVYLDANNNGTLDSGERFTTTAANGSYSFTNLTLGGYVVREVVPTGYIRTGPVLVDNYAVTLTSAAPNSTGNNFTNAEKCDADDIICVSFFIRHTDGTTETVTNLRGRTREGDLITVTFTMNIPAGTTHPVTFVSYTAPEPYFNANTASQ
ncbi:MAG: hypothetical protein K2V38_07285, partial [Gemmataceae bacterium]|nr:hypothetical protein [Gemmataceae bacterium]